jgi:ABC-type branched-subunit amino acid transport system substrate-binding protein
MPSRKFLSSSKRSAACVGAAVLVAAVAGCGSSKSGNASSGDNSSSAGLKTVTVGVLLDATGPAASGNKTATEGVKAGTYYAARNGYKIKYVEADTATNPSTALSAAQKLVTQNHVDAVIVNSALTFAAAPYLTQRGIPVIGAGEDGPEWTTAKNMFSVFGALNTTKVAETTGKLFKQLGVTTVGAVGYSVSPISSETAKAAAESAKQAGLKVGYLNAKFPFGSTNVGPIALAMKKAGVNGFTATTDPNTAFSLITALRDSGVDIKAAMLATGYGGDLEQAGPGALNAAQNVYFSMGYEPVEMQDAATKQFVSDLKSAGISSSPTYAEYNGYVSVGLLVRALKAAGSTDKSGLISALSNIHDWDALGLFGSHKLNLSDRTSMVSGVDNCLWVTKLVGKNFQLVKGATPICGATIPGVTVSASS